jgi:hypothetical protein
MATYIRLSLRLAEKRGLIVRLELPIRPSRFIEPLAISSAERLTPCGLTNRPILINGWITTNL